jgi:exoribonuclease-2
MNLLFEEAGEFKTGAVLSQAGEAYQVELPTGKRAKVRARDVLFQYANQSPQQLMTDAQEVADEIDLDFLWEVAGETEFGFAELGSEYFGREPKPHESAGLLLRMHAAPMYFYKKGKGRYKAAPQESLKAALASIERKRQQEVIQQEYVEELKQRRLPPAIAVNARQLLFKPDKNGIEYKALHAACAELHTTPPRLLLETGAIASPKDLHLAKFLFEHFPRGTDFPPFKAPQAVNGLPQSDAQAFSIDDIGTTEIDDAFSVSRLADGKVKVGIHIAAPALAIRPHDTVDALARQRMSTVYMPGSKITMLPDELVEAFTLGAGQYRPAISLYVTLDPADWSVVTSETRAESVKVVSNLRHNDLDHLITPESLASGAGDYPHKEALALLWEWAQVLEKGRMAKRESFGLRPEQVNRVDFNFYVEDDVVTIERRQRGAPLDKIVAELMIFVNSAWGKLLHDHGVPGIYRSQGGGGGWSRMQVRMVAHAAPHMGLGVDQYAWSTSPLRRYTDLVNQWQILACIQHGVAAPLTAAFKPKDADLFAIISAFDATYGAYAEFQSHMERYWCLQWLKQRGVRQVEGAVIRDDVVRLTEIPLVINLPGMPTLARGTAVRIEVIRWDEVDLTVEARLIEVASTALPADEEENEEGSLD